MAPENAPPSAGSALASAATRCATLRRGREANHAAPATGRFPPVSDRQSRRPAVTSSLLRNEPVGLVVGRAQAIEPLVEPGPHFGVGEDVEVVVADAA